MMSNGRPPWVRHASASEKSLQSQRPCTSLVNDVDSLVFGMSRSPILDGSLPRNGPAGCGQFHTLGQGRCRCCRPDTVASDPTAVLPPVWLPFNSRYRGTVQRAGLRSILIDREAVY